MTPLMSATPHWNIPQLSSHLLFYLINTLCKKQRWAASIVGSSRLEPHGKSRHHSKEPFSHLLSKNSCSRFLKLLRAVGQWEPEDEGVSKDSGGGGRFILCPICMGFHWQEVFPTPEEEFSHIADPRGEQGCPWIILASWRRSVFLPYICSSFCSWCLPLTVSLYRLPILMSNTCASARNKVIWEKLMFEPDQKFAFLKHKDLDPIYLNFLDKNINTFIYELSF